MSSLVALWWTQSCPNFINEACGHRFKGPGVGLFCTPSLILAMLNSQWCSGSPPSCSLFEAFQTQSVSRCHFFLPGKYSTVKQGVVSFIYWFNGATPSLTSSFAEPIAWTFTRAFSVDKEAGAGALLTKHHPPLVLPAHTLVAWSSTHRPREWVGNQIHK